jgi:hypothetical protein
MACGHGTVPTLVEIKVEEGKQMALNKFLSFSMANFLHL